MEVLYSRHLLSGALGQEYDAFVDGARGGHYMQTRAFGDVTVTGRHVERRFLMLRSGGRVRGTALILRSKKGPIPSPSVTIERGPVTADPEDLEEILPSMLKTLRRHGILKVKMQPYWAGSDAEIAKRVLSRHGFLESTDRDGPHACTLRLDLDVPRTEIFAGSERSFLRNKTKQAEKLGATCVRGTSSDLALLASLYNEMMAEQNMEGKPTSFFSAFEPLLRTDAAAIFRCDFEGQAVGCVLVLRHGGQVTFHIGATTKEKKPFKKMLLPLVRAAEWAHEVGAKRFDLGGVPEEDDTDEKRSAIAQFKFDFSKARVPLLRVHHRASTAAAFVERFPVTTLKPFTSWKRLFEQR